MIRVWYYIVSRSGADRQQWLDLFTKNGLGPIDEFTPIYHDTKPRKPTGGTVSFEQLPSLKLALASLGIGERLTIPHFGHLVSPCIWRVVAGKLVEKGAEMESLADSGVFDGTDQDAGLRLMKFRAGRSLTDARVHARVKTGRPRRGLAGKRLEEALRLFIAPEWSADRISKHFGMGRMTLLRRIEETTGTMSKGEAMDLNDEGNWPPKRKLTR